MLIVLWSRDALNGLVGEGGAAAPSLATQPNTEQGEPFTALAPQAGAFTYFLANVGKDRRGCEYSVDSLPSRNDENRGGVSWTVLGQDLSILESADSKLRAFRLT